MEGTQQRRRKHITRPGLVDNLDLRSLITARHAVIVMNPALLGLREEDMFAILCQILFDIRRFEDVFLTEDNGIQPTQRGGIVPAVQADTTIGIPAAQPSLKRYQ